MSETYDIVTGSLCSLLLQVLGLNILYKCISAQSIDIEYLGTEPIVPASDDR
ncbi:hypothetical protein B7P43_G05475 [Cryptotermes secundus]|uniref:Uncharacterized protein n=1 Tax=Cryptotermes secundus TaxID=105785 RepID=A0A2J7R1E5_9NEOP|nr:hypothetical protein B7P43_G05475 [Cryptotermes secundus]